MKHWRTKCPEGHVRTKAREEYFYCQQCSKRVPHVIDEATGRKLQAPSQQKQVIAR